MLRKVNLSGLTTISLSAFIFVLVSIPALGSSARELSLAVQGTAPQTSHPAFTLTTSRKVTRADGQERLLSIQQRFQRSDGLYKLMQTFYAPDGTTERVQTLF